MNHSRNYVEMVLRLMKDDPHQGDIWRGFLSLAAEYTRVDWKQSVRLARRHRCVLRGCYDNALRVARVHPELQYCEGFATSLIPGIEHAWLVDPVRLVVVDPTWCLSKGPLDPSETRPDDPTPDYFGVSIPWKRVTLERSHDHSRPSWLPVVLDHLGKKRKP